jgi:ubiquinol-cytochrome c reductase cytochrome b subunit
MRRLISQVTNSVLSWLEERTGLPSTIRGFFDEEIPVSAGWHQVFGSMALFCFVLQAVTGLLLAFNYAATVSEAHASIRYIMNEVTGGAMIRGLHHWGSSAMIIVVVVHMLQVFLWGAYKKPREATWLVGLVLLLITLGFGLTGYLLPWDNRAYWGTVVTAQITGNSPGMGQILLRLIGAEDGVGAVTFSRFYTLHTVLLPLVIAGMIALHMMLVRKHGVAPAPGDDGTRKKRFFPEQVAKDTVAIFALFMALMYLSITLSAPLGRQADPTDTSFIPRPEWYFLFLFQALKIFEGPMELVGSHILPGLAMAALAVLPFLDRTKTQSLRQRVPALVVALMALGTWGGLTRSAVLSTPAKDRPFAERGGPQDWQELKPSQLAGLALVRSNNCTECHSIAGRGATAGKDGGTAAPDFASLGSGRDPVLLAKSFEEKSAAWMTNHSAQQLPPARVKDMLSLLVHLDPLNAPGILNAESGVADGALIYQANGCASCHAIHGEGGDVGPALDGVGSRRERDWLRRHFVDPPAVVPETIMPPYALPEPQMKVLLDYLLAL